ncbi:MAG: hypothetical protein KGI02_09615 [Thaumarchaeota archaeon]|nr:hypothetical protein [Nitrososphaerota archaeon]MDE1841614.1 hypothetical protein [Nitrososphaerota archaeon]MDE1878307.1 hypothetical protein [Nitrososphaerota archaeon]
MKTLGGLNLHEISGHILWGLFAGAASLSFRYTILAGFFAVLIDSDHLIALTHLDALFRMSHSISFGIISVIVLMILFGKRNYLLGAAAIAGLLSHLSFDTLQEMPSFHSLCHFTITRYHSHMRHGYFLS